MGTCAPLPSRARGYPRKLLLSLYIRSYGETFDRDRESDKLVLFEYDRESKAIGEEERDEGEKVRKVMFSCVFLERPATIVDKNEFRTEEKN